MIQLRHISVSLGNRPILKDVSLETVAEGVVAVMGPSGCGKSTLLKALMGIVQCQAGEIQVVQQTHKAHTWSSQQRVFTLVPQSPLLLPWKTLLHNVLMAANPVLPKATQRERAQHLLEVVGLADAQHLFPHEISQGMAARASFARTLMIESQVLLLDEPFAAIDAATRFKLQQWLLNTITALNIQALLVTHDPREALLVADRIVVLGGRPARIVESLELPPRERRTEADWIFSAEAGSLEKKLRRALEPVPGDSINSQSFSDS